jgi:hypothetical protein
MLRRAAVSAAAGGKGGVLKEEEAGLCVMLKHVLMMRVGWCKRGDQEPSGLSGELSTAA